MQDISRKSAEKSWSGLFCSCFLLGTLSAGRYWSQKDRREEDCEGGGKRVIGKAMERDEFGLRVGGFVMQGTCATIREGWDCVAEWRREGGDDGKDTGVVDKVNVSFAEAVSGGNCDVERKLVPIHSD